MSRFKSWLVRLVSSWPGVKGRRAIFDRLARIEARTLELQIQLARRIDAVETRVSTDGNAATTKLEGFVQIITDGIVQNTAHSQAIEDTLGSWISRLDIAEGVLQRHLEDAMTMQRMQSARLEAIEATILKTANRSGEDRKRFLDQFAAVTRELEAARTRAAADLAALADRLERLGGEVSDPILDRLTALEADWAAPLAARLERLGGEVSDPILGRLTALETDWAAPLATRLERLGGEVSDPILGRLTALEADWAALLAVRLDALGDRVSTEHDQSGARLLSQLGALATSAEIRDGLTAVESSALQRLDALDSRSETLLLETRLQLGRLLQTASLGALGRPLGPRIRVLFAVHFIEVWSNIEPVYRAMAASDDFEPIVVSHAYDFTGEGFGGEDRVHEHLEERGVPHLRWGAMDAWPSENFIRYMAPDVIFRQTPYEMSSPDPLRTAYLGIARLCYVPYNLYVADVSDSSVNHEYLLACWRVFAINDSNKRYFAQHSKVGDTRVVVTGLPKLDVIRDMTETGGEWPVRSDQRRFRILWAPHHSVTTDWLGFGTFPNVYKDMLAWAREDESVEIVLRPHHLTFGKLVSSGVMTQAEVDLFLNEWEALPNTAIDDKANCAYTFGASDVLVTDGVSFLAEYIPTNKPLIFLDSGVQTGLTELGAESRSVAYSVSDVAAAQDFVAKLRADGHDPHAAARAAMISKLMPSPGGAAQAILDEIRTSIRPKEQ
jgi:hypothetical protein